MTFGKLFNDVLSGGTIFQVPAPVPPVPPGQPFATQPWGQYGSSPIYIQYKVGASLAGGNVSLQDPAPGQPNGAIKVDNLKILWNELKFQVNIDLPQITVGAIHTSAVTIDVPGIGTVTLVPAIDFPGITLFGGGDIQIPIDLSPLNLVSEASMSAEPVVYYGTGNPNVQNCPNRWQFYVVPEVPIFVWPVFSFNLTNAITTGINQFFNNIFGQYPGPVVDAIKAASGGRADRRLQRPVDDILRPRVGGGVDSGHDSQRRPRSQVRAGPAPARFLHEPGAHIRDT